MADPRFFTRAGPFSLAELARIAGADMGQGADPDALFHDVRPLGDAEAGHVGFLDNRRYVDAFSRCRAGAVLVHPDLADRAPAGVALLLTQEPYHGYARVAQAYYPGSTLESGVAAGALVDDSAVLGQGCRVEPGAVVGARAEIGARCHIQANAVIGSGVVLGDDCVIGPGVSLVCCLVGSRVIVHAGARVGQDGFGFAMGPTGHIKVPQLGRVIIEDDVEIGANTTIDRGAGPDTVIGAGSKIDNLVQIAHNVRIGRNCIIVSQVGISGSTEVGDFVAMAGQAGLTGHLKIGSGARIAAQAGVMRDVDPGSAIGGSPAVPVKEYWRQVAVLQGLARKRKGG